jgi:hypothetical protein
MADQFSNQRAGPLASQELGSDFESRHFDEILRSLVGGKQRLHLAA